VCIEVLCIYIYYIYLQDFWSRDSSVGIATGWTAGLRFLAGAGDFSLLQIGSGANSASYPIGSGGSFPGGKAALA
jgi:hypothetical protein